MKRAWQSINKIIVALALLLIPLMPFSTTSADPTVTEDYITVGNTSTNYPYDIVSGPDGALWFTNHNFESLVRISTSGGFTGYDTDPVRGIGLTLGSDNHLWTDDTNGSQIVQLNTDGSTANFPLPAGYANPRAITSGVGGNLWLTYSNSSNESQGFVAQATTSGAFTSYALPDYGYLPYSFTTGPDSAMWFTETNTSGTSSKIGRISSTGDITVYPLSVAATAITAGPDGALWFTSNGQIGRITTGGTVSTYPLPSGSTPNQITSGPDGALWLTDTHGSVDRITTTGAVSTYALSASSDPQGVTVGPDGAIWFTEPGFNRIGRILPVPVVPAGLNASSPTLQPSLSWNAVSGATSYNVYRNGSLLGNTTSTTYADTSVPHDGTYSYYVTAVNASGESAPSNALSVVVDVAPVVTVTGPSATTIVSGTVNITGTIYANSAYSRMLYAFNSSGQSVVAKYQYAVPNATTGYAYSWDTTQVPNGVYTINLSAKDSQNNKDQYSTSVIKVAVNN